MEEIEEVIVKKYRCPVCRKLGSSRSRAKKHLEACPSKPEIRACMTCAHDGFVALGRDRDGVAHMKAACRLMARGELTFIKDCPEWEFRNRGHDDI
jgi:hypothetical protein